MAAASLTFTIQPPQRLALEQFMPAMGGRNRPRFVQMLADHRALFQSAPGSKANHQAWPGGYWDHVTECLNLAVAHYSLWSALRPLEYGLWEALEVLFAHDLEKPWKYQPDAPCPIPVPDLQEKSPRAVFRLDLLQYYEVELSDRQQNAMRYCEGELGDYSADHRTMRPLAHLCHTCDETSARQFPEHPSATDDAWQGASRIAQ